MDVNIETAVLVYPQIGVKETIVEEVIDQGTAEEYAAAWEVYQA